jgi:hypothetical protein
MIGRRFGPLITLFLVLVGLAGGVVYEAQDWPAAITEPTGFPTGGGRPTNAGSPVGLTAPTGAAVLQTSLNTWRDEILSRPLFSPGRRPAVVAAQSMTGLSRLTGIIHTGTRKVAIFAAPSGGAPIIVEEGAHVGAYEVRQIGDTNVTVAGPEGVTVIRPIFDPTPPAKPKVTPTPAAPVPGRAAQVAKP